MKRTVILLSIIGLLGATIAWLTWEKPTKRTLELGEDRQFAIEDIERIQKIFLADRAGNRTLLERGKDQWLFNGDYKANPNAIDNLLDAIHRIEMKYQPANAAVKGMIANLATQGIKVEIYDRQEQLLKAYYVGGATPDERGTYMIMEGAEQPNVVSIPGWEGNVRVRYRLTGDQWKDKTIFSEKVENIVSVSIVYPKQKSKSFRVERSGQVFSVEPYYETTPPINSPVEQGIIERFLVGFNRIGAEAFENNNPKRDSIRQTLPFCVINLKRLDGDSLEVKLHPIYPQQAYATNTGLPITNNSVERFFADCSTGDFMLVQNRLFKKVLWAYDFFFERK